MTLPGRVWSPVRERVVYPAFRLAAGVPLRALFRTSRRGVERVPRRGGAIVAFNHASFLDAPLVIACIPRPLYLLGKRYTFGNRLTAAFLERVGGQIPISETGSNERALAAAVATVEAGRVLALAPEGTRSPDGRLRRGHTGVAIVAFSTGRPVVPVAVTGTFAAWPRGRRLPRLLSRTSVLVGEPIVVPRDDEAAEDPRRCRALTDRVMGAIAELLGEAPPGGQTGRG